MRLLVLGIDDPPVEPTSPRKASVKDEDIPFELEKYKKLMDRYYKKKDEYDENKAKVLVIIKGQCTLTMRSRGSGKEREFKLRSVGRNGFVRIIISKDFYMPQHFRVLCLGPCRGIA